MGVTYERGPGPAVEPPGADELWLSALLAVEAARVTPVEAPREAIARRGRALRRRRAAVGLMAAAALLAPLTAIAVTDAGDGHARAAATAVAPAGDGRAGTAATAPPVPDAGPEVRGPSAAPVGAERIDMAAGTMAGRSWSLVYDSEVRTTVTRLPGRTSEEPAHCSEGFRLYLDGRPVNQAGGGCSNDAALVGPGEFHALAVADEGRDLGTLVFGSPPVAAAGVVATPYGGGAPVTAPVRTAPDGMRFYLFAFPAGSIARAGTVTFVDAQGAVVATLPEVALGKAK